MNDLTQIVTTLTQEEQELLYFSNPTDYHTRLQQYLAYPQGFITRTIPSGRNTALSTTQTFRHYLRHFIHSYKPAPLLPRNNLRLHLDQSGRFFLRLSEHDIEITDVSEADFYIFQYRCFLEIRRFWDSIRECYCFPGTQLPILMRDFSHLLENDTDFKVLLDQSQKIASQIIVL